MIIALRSASVRDAGDVSEQEVLLFLHGTGADDRKSTLIGAVIEEMDDYAMRAAPQSY